MNVDNAVATDRVARSDEGGGDSGYPRAKSERFRVCHSNSHLFVRQTPWLNILRIPWPTLSITTLSTLPWWNWPSFERTFHLPQIGGFQITHFMVMELIASVLLVAILVPVVRHIARTPYSRGWFMNMFEAMLLFIRDDVARPAIGGHGADRFLPYLWTAFFFVLFNNLLGMIPGGASATGNVNVTAVLALMTLAVVVSAGTREMGVVGLLAGARSAHGRPRVAQAGTLGIDVRDRNRRAPDPPCRARSSVICQYVRGARGPRGHPGLHSDDEVHRPRRFSWWRPPASSAWFS